MSSITPSSLTLTPTDSRPPTPDSNFHRLKSDGTFYLENGTKMKVSVGGFTKADFANPEKFAKIEIFVNAAFEKIQNEMYDRLQGGKLETLRVKKLVGGEFVSYAKVKGIADARSSFGRKNRLLSFKIERQSELKESFDVVGNVLAGVSFRQLLMNNKTGYEKLLENFVSNMKIFDAEMSEEDLVNLQISRFLNQEIPEIIVERGDSLFKALNKKLLLELEASKGVASFESLKILKQRLLSACAAVWVLKEQVMTDQPELAQTSTFKKLISTLEKVSDAIGLCEDIDENTINRLTVEQKTKIQKLEKEEDERYLSEEQEINKFRAERGDGARVDAPGSSTPGLSSSSPTPTPVLSPASASLVASSGSAALHGSVPNTSLVPEPAASSTSAPTTPPSVPISATLPSTPPPPEQPAPSPPLVPLPSPLPAQPPSPTPAPSPTPEQAPPLSSSTPVPPLPNLPSLLPPASPSV